MRPRLAGLLLFALSVAGCQADDGPSVPSPDPPADVPATPTGDAGTGVMVLDGEIGPSPVRPVAPLRVEGACPMECCQYGTWTTSGPTPLFATAGDSTAVAATVDAGTALAVSTGHVLLTRLGEAVLREPTMLYRDFEDGVQAQAGDTLLVLYTVGEGAWRVWYPGASGGEILEADGSALGAYGSPVFPDTQWWARATTPDGTTGWLWMERTPPVTGADGCAGPPEGTL